MKVSHHVKLYYTVIDIQFQDLNCHFNEANSKLLLCVFFFFEQIACAIINIANSPEA